LELRLWCAPAALQLGELKPTGTELQSIDVTAASFGATDFEVGIVCFSEDDASVIEPAEPVLTLPGVSIAQRCVDRYPFARGQHELGPGVPAVCLVAETTEHRACGNSGRPAQCNE
jgi:hypothetical protein